VSEIVAFRSTRYGAGCGHPTTDHVGAASPQPDCCCCTQRQNCSSHIDTCLDCSVVHAKYRLRHEGISVPTVGDVAPFIPQSLVGEFWVRYIGKYFDSTLDHS
jgi:hypothetical protein